MSRAALHAPARTRIRALLAPVFATALLCACSAGAGASPSGSVIEIGGGPVRIGGPAPAFQLVDLSGHQVKLADYTGRPVIVNFWASWCVPCQQEFPMYRQARRQYAAKGLEILGVIYKDSPDAARGFMSKESAAWPALVDPNGSVAQAYAIVGIPDSFFVDRKGVVRALSYGPPSQSDLAQYLGKIL